MEHRQYDILVAKSAGGELVPVTIHLPRNDFIMVDIVGTVYHLVIYMQSNKIHKVF